jgi:hypothetical protein
VIFSRDQPVDYFYGKSAYLVVYFEGTILLGIHTENGVIMCYIAPLLVQDKKIL